MSTHYFTTVTGRSIGGKRENPRLVAGAKSINSSAAITSAAIGSPSRQGKPTLDQLGYWRWQRFAAIVLNRPASFRFVFHITPQPSNSRGTARPSGPTTTSKCSASIAFCAA